MNPVKTMNILIVGDSLALPRPHRIKQFDPDQDRNLAVHFHETYGAILHQQLSQRYPDRSFLVTNRAQRFFTMKNVCEQFVDHLFFFQPDVIVMQVGIVDCWPRQELGGNQLVNLEDFKKYYSHILSCVKKRPEVKLIVVGICPTSLKMENRYPGVLKHIDSYNEALRSGSDDQQVFFLDMSVHVSPENPHVYLLPDDHHLNREGNSLIATKLTSMIEAFIENEAGCLVFERDPVQSYRHFQKSFSCFPRYGDNLYNLIYLSSQLGDWASTAQYVKFVREERIHHPALLDLVRAIKEQMSQ